MSRHPLQQLLGLRLGSVALNELGERFYVARLNADQRVVVFVLGVR
jgi:hypothetical protein